MVDREYIDSKKPVRRLTGEVLDKIYSLSPQIRAAADVAGVSPLAVAGPMAREMNKHMVGDYARWYVPLSNLAQEKLARDLSKSYALYSLRDNAAWSQQQPNSPFSAASDFVPFAPVPPKRYTHEDYVSDMRATDGDIPRSAGPLAYLHKWQFQEQHPVMNELGLASIRLRTAIKSLEFYLDHPKLFKGRDPFRWEKYRGHYDAFAYDLAQAPTSDEMSVKVSAANAAYINGEMAKRARNWGQITQDQRDEYITADSASGGAIVNKERLSVPGRNPPWWNIHEQIKAAVVAPDINRMIRLDPAKLAQTDGANYLAGPAGELSNLDRLRNVLEPPSIPPFYARPEWGQDSPSERRAPSFPPAFNGPKRGAAIERYGRNASDHLATLDRADILSQVPMIPSGLGQFVMPGHGDWNAPWRNAAISSTDQQAGRPFGDPANRPYPSYVPAEGITGAANANSFSTPLSDGSTRVEGGIKPAPFGALGFGAPTAFQFPNAVVSPAAKAIAAAPPRNVNAGASAPTHVSHQNVINVHIDGKMIAQEIMPIVTSILSNDVLSLGEAVLDGYRNDHSEHRSSGG